MPTAEHQALHHKLGCTGSRVSALMQQRPTLQAHLAQGSDASSVHVQKKPELALGNTVRLRLAREPSVEHVGHVVLADAVRSTCALAMPAAFWNVLNAAYRWAPTGTRQHRARGAISQADRRAAGTDASLNVSSASALALHTGSQKEAKVWCLARLPPLFAGTCMHLSHLRLTQRLPPGATL